MGVDQNPPPVKTSAKSTDTESKPDGVQHDSLSDEDRRNNADNPYRERALAILKDSSVASFAELTLIIEDRAFGIDEAEIITRALRLEEEMIDRIFHGGKRAAYERLVSDVLEKRHIKLDQWKTMRAYALLDNNDLVMDTDKRLHLLVKGIVEDIEAEVAASMTGVDYMQHAVSEYAYHRAEAEYRREKELKEGMEKMAATDEKTGFIRDVSYADKLFEVERKHLHELPDNRCMLVIVVDLNDFKRENESHAEGHVGVDRDIIVPLGRALESTLRGIDIKGRPGGDEFFFIINDVNLAADSKDSAAFHATIDNNNDAATPPQIQRILGKIQQAIESVTRVDGTPLTASIGYAILEQSNAAHGPSLSELMTNGDNAAIHAKHRAAKVKGNTVIIEHRPDLEKPEQDLEFYKYNIKKGLGRVFPGEDLTAISEIIDQMASQMAEQEAARKA